MSEKPTYEELEQRIRELEQNVSNCKTKEKTSKNALELLSFFIKHSPIYAFLKRVSHKDSQVLFASDNYIDMTGIPASQMVGKTMHELFPEEFAAKITRDDIAVINKGDNLILDEELNGRNYITYKFPLMQDGKEYLAGYTVDVTDLKRTEADLAQVFAMSLDMICIADINTATFIKVNPAFTEILGYSEEELLEKPFFDFLHPDDIDETLTVIDQRLQKGAKVINFENRYRCKDGSYRWLNWASHPIAEQGVTFGVARDITEEKQKEEILRKSKALLDATGRMARVGGWELDTGTMEVTWTEETYRIHGVPLGQKPDLREAIDFFHPDDRAQLEQAITRALDHGEPYDMEIRFITAKGKNLWTRTICHPEIIDGKIVRLMGTFHDITHRKKAEIALLKSERKWRDILVNTPQIGIALNPNAEIVFVNKYFLKLTGWMEQEIIGRDWFDMFIPENIRQDVREVFKTVMNHKDTHNKLSSYENEIMAKDGTLRNVAWSNVVTKDAQGEIVDVTCLGIDLTERRRAEEVLRRSEEKYRLLVENQTDLVVKVDLDGRFLFVSPSYCRMFGKEEKELLGESFIPLVHEEDREPTTKAMEVLFSPPYTTYIEHRAMSKEGWRWLAWVNTAVFDSAGSVTEIIGVGRDITDKKRAEEKQARLENQLRQAQKMESIGRLAGGVAHDFNNMLSIISGNTELALEDINAENPITSNLQEIRKAAERSANLTRQLLAFARKQTISPKILDLNQTVTGMLNMLRRLIGENIDLAWLPKHDLWPIKLDPSQVDQVLANLCVNARDSIQGVGKITIETNRVSFDEDYCREHEGFKLGEYTMLAVSDNGSGMDKDTVDNIFEPFYSTKNVGQGTGLGLATVYGIVKQNEGFINVYSEPGKGTTIKIYFSRHIVESIPQQKQDVEDKQVGGDETILLVEDEKAVLRMTTTILERLGYKVLPSSSPTEGVHIGESYTGEIQMLITDVVMPEMSGREVAEKLFQSYPDLKCLFMSGYTANVIAHHGILNDGINFLNKPFSRQDLAAKIREILDDKK